MQTNPQMLQYRLEVIGNEQYQRIGFKTISSNYPDYLYYNPTYPFGTITLYPVPNIALQLILSQTSKLLDISYLQQVISLPPGYERALIYNLAIELAPRYGRASQVVPGSTIWRLAKESFADLKRTNQERRIMTSDASGLFGSRGGVYNPYTDSYNSNV